MQDLTKEQTDSLIADIKLAYECVFGVPPTGELDEAELKLFIVFADIRETKAKLSHLTLVPGIIPASVS